MKVPGIRSATLLSLFFPASWPALSTAQSSGVAPVTVLVPVTDATGSVADSAAADNNSYPVFRLAERSSLVRQVYDVLKTSFVQEVLRLERYARNLLVSESVGAERSDLGAPAYLLMSAEEGGFARRGFWLQDMRGQRHLVRAGYVDLVITKESVENGNLAETFAHELGHQILHELIGTLPPGRSRNMHQSMTVTDYPTALDEGYAEHFQPLARDARAKAGGVTATDLDLLWISRLDAQLRTDGVKNNRFIHRTAMPAAALDTLVDRYALYVQGETSTAFVDELRSGQEMMASEGVIATLFYRLVNNPALRDHRRETAFYKPFLGAGRLGQIVSPYENANLKLFAALHRAARAIGSGAAPMIALLQSYAETFPDEARAIYTVLIETTRGATVSQEAAHAFEQASREGRSGNIDAFRSVSRAAFLLLDSTIDRVVRREITADANLGPQIWLLNADFKIAAPLWNSHRTLALTLNLNTATEVDLMTIRGVDLRMARQVVALRRARGYFRSLDDLTGVVTPDVQRTLVSMREQMDSAGVYRRP